MAVAFEDSLVYNEELVSKVKFFFKKEDLSDPCFKLALVPSTSRLNYGLDQRTGKTTLYPLVSVQNVFIFPGQTINALLRNIMNSQISMIMLNILWRMSNGTGTFFIRKENNTNFILFFIPVPLFKRKGENIIQKRSLYTFESINGSSFLTFFVKLSVFQDN